MKKMMVLLIVLLNFGLSLDARPRVLDSDTRGKDDELATCYNRCMAGPTDWVGHER